MSDLSIKTQYNAYSYLGVDSNMDDRSILVHLLKLHLNFLLACISVMLESLDANTALTISVEGLKNKSKVLEEKLETTTKDAQLLQQQVSTLEADKGKLKLEKDEAIEEGYTRCISGSAYTIALFQHHLPNLDLGLLDVGFRCDAAQRDALMEQTHDAADAFVTSLKLIPEDAPAEEEAVEDQ
ncbi:hypothetical protein EJB05_25603, partial [Eragrostis curvula]